MPGLDGFEACRRIKSDERTRHIPVLMLSATFMETEAQVEGLETGADAYLTQPVEAPVLAATIRSLLRARSLEAEVRLAAVGVARRRSTRSATRWRCSTPTGVVQRANRAFLRRLRRATRPARACAALDARARQRRAERSASASTACASTPSRTTPSPPERRRS